MLFYATLVFLSDTEFSQSLGSEQLALPCVHSQRGPEPFSMAIMATRPFPRVGSRSSAEKMTPYSCH